MCDVWWWERFSGVFRVRMLYFFTVGGVFVPGRLVCWFLVEWVLKIVKWLVYKVFRGYFDVPAPIIPIYFQSQVFFPSNTQGWRVFSTAHWLDDFNVSFRIIWFWKHLLPVWNWLIRYCGSIGMAYSGMVSSHILWGGFDLIVCNFPTCFLPGISFLVSVYIQPFT